MFEGKEGHRIFSERNNAEFVAERNSMIEKKEFEVQKVKVIDQKVARRLNLSTHPDLSISARPPKEGEIGWIVTENPKKLIENYGKALEFIEE